MVVASQEAGRRRPKGRSLREGYRQDACRDGFAGQPGIGEGEGPFLSLIPFKPSFLTGTVSLHIIHVWVKSSGRFYL